MNNYILIISHGDESYLLRSIELLLAHLQVNKARKIAILRPHIILFQDVALTSNIYSQLIQENHWNAQLALMLVAEHKGTLPQIENFFAP